MKPTEHDFCVAELRSMTVIANHRMDRITELKDKVESERAKVARLKELAGKIVKAQRTASIYLANPCNKIEHYPSLYVSCEVESWFQKLEKELEQGE